MCKDSNHEVTDKKETSSYAAQSHTYKPFTSHGHCIMLPDI